MFRNGGNYLNIFSKRKTETIKFSDFMKDKKQEPNLKLYSLNVPVLAFFDPLVIGVGGIIVTFVLTQKFLEFHGLYDIAETLNNIGLVVLSLAGTIAIFMVISNVAGVML